MQPLKIRPIRPTTRQPLLGASPDAPRERTRIVRGYQPTSILQLPKKDAPGPR